MGGRSNRRTGTKQKEDKTEEISRNTSESEASEHKDNTAEKMDGADHNKMLRVGLATISKDIKDLKQEI